VNKKKTISGVIWNMLKALNWKKIIYCCVSLMLS